MAQIPIKGLVHFFLFLLMIPLASAQCPNNLAVYNPNLRTACVNGSTLPLPDSLPIAQTTSPTDTLPQPFSLYPLIQPQSKAPSSLIVSYPFPRPMKPCSRTGSQQGCIPCWSKLTWKPISACRRCRSRRRCCLAASRCRM